MQLTKNLISVQNEENNCSYFNTKNKWDAPMEKRIDYIFVQGGIKVLKYAVLTDAKEQRFPSDHLPVFVKVQ